MSDEHANEIVALTELRNEFIRLAAADPLAQQRAGRVLSSRGKLALVIAAVVALAAASLTPPGRAIADRLGELVGIGEPATLPPKDQGPHLIDRAEAVVIASGHAPDGAPYEVVANRSVTNYSEPRPVPLGEDPEEYAAEHPNGPVTCVTVDLPEAPRANAVEFCLGASDQGLLGKTGYLDGTNVLDRGSDFAEGDDPGPEARYMLTAELSPDITDVEVTYENDRGRRIEAYSDVGLVDAEIAELIGTDDRIGWLIAFLPDDSLPPNSTRHGPVHLQGPGVLGTVELVGFDESGTAVARDDYGDRYARHIAAQSREIEREREMQRRVEQALETNDLGFTLCLKAMRARITGEARDACLDTIRAANDPDVPVN